MASGGVASPTDRCAACGLLYLFYTTCIPHRTNLADLITLSLQQSDTHTPITDTPPPHTHTHTK